MVCNTLVTSAVYIGSNTIEVLATQTNRYKYVVRFEGPGKDENWTVVNWNKIRPDSIIGGWYGKACKKFALAASQIRRFLRWLGYRPGSLVLVNTVPAP